MTKDLLLVFRATSNTTNCSSVYDPVAITLIILKCFERIVKTFRDVLIPTTLHPTRSWSRNTYLRVQCASAIVLRKLRGSLTLGSTAPPWD